MISLKKGTLGQTEYLLQNKSTKSNRGEQKAPEGNKGEDQGCSKQKLNKESDHREDRMVRKAPHISTREQPNLPKSFVLHENTENYRNPNKRIILTFTRLSGNRYRVRDNRDRTWTAKALSVSKSRYAPGWEVDFQMVSFLGKGHRFPMRMDSHGNIIGGIVDLKNRYDPPEGPHPEFKTLCTGRVRKSYL